MSDAQIARDVAEKVRQTVKDTLMREMKIAHLVLEPADLAVLLVRIAIGVVGTAAITIAGMAHERPDAASVLYDEVIDQIVKGVRDKRAEAFADMQARYAEAAR